MTCCNNAEWLSPKDSRGVEELEVAYDVLASFAAIVGGGSVVQAPALECMPGATLRRALYEVATNPQRETELWQRVKTITDKQLDMAWRAGSK